MFQCPECGCTEFYAHQKCIMDVKVDGNNDFLDTVSGDSAADIYDAAEPFGPYECVNCGAEYDYLER